MKRIALAGLVVVLLLGTNLLEGKRSASATPGQGTLYGTSGDLRLLTIDPVTGQATTVGPLFLPSPAIAIHPSTGVLYAGGGAGLPFLLTLDKSDALPSLVGYTGLGFASISDMDFSPNGTLYASVNIAGDGGTGGDHLATIDIATGAATVIGPFGVCTGVIVPSFGLGSCSIEGMEGLAFSPSGVLYASHTRNSPAGQPGLYTVNTATGAATFVAPIVNSLSQPPAGGIASLHFSCNGTLYGGTTRSTGNNGGNLVTINPATGVFTNVGAASATGGSGLAALAFNDTTCLADMAITKTGSATGPVVPGATIAYTLTVTNNGPGMAINVAVSDPIPANMTFDSLLQTSGPMFTVQTPAAGGTGTLTLTIASMTAGQSAVFRIVVKASQTASGTIVNTATVTNAVPDNNQGNNSASASTGIEVPASPTPARPPVIPQVFQNPAVQGIFTNPRPSTVTPVIQTLAPAQAVAPARPLVIQPPRTGDGGLLCKVLDC